MGNYVLGLGAIKALSQGIEGKVPGSTGTGAGAERRVRAAAASRSRGAASSTSCPGPSAIGRRPQEHLRRALAMNPAALRARVYLAISLMDSGHPQEAKRFLTKWPPPRSVATTPRRSVGPRRSRAPYSPSSTPSSSDRLTLATVRRRLREEESSSRSPGRHATSRRSRRDRSRQAARRSRRSRGCGSPARSSTATRVRSRRSSAGSNTPARGASVSATSSSTSRASSLTSWTAANRASVDSATRR